MNVLVCKKKKKDFNKKREATLKREKHDLEFFILGFKKKYFYYKF